mmetsp:Transcript_6021/g.15401  ORF Transcript_6021/g.15401 Transcript_6021/m.15401 type:complete len:96 (-) Transcript_6021:21-308(-)
MPLVDRNSQVFHFTHFDISLAYSYCRNAGMCSSLEAQADDRGGAFWPAIVVSAIVDLVKTSYSDDAADAKSAHRASGAGRRLCNVMLTSVRPTKY